MPGPDEERRRVQEQIDYLARIAIDPEQLRIVIAESVADGLRSAVSDPKMWEAASKAMQVHATHAAGGLLIGGMKTLFKNALLWGMAGWAIYSIGGWTALTAAAKALFGGHPP